MENRKIGTNFPIKGISKDTHNSIITGDYATDLLNVRMVGSEGSNFIIVNIDGNEELFSLRSTFYPLGMRAYNNILYIISANSEGTVEIGSFPSPKCLQYYAAGYYELYNYDPDVTGLENVYKPLVNIGENASGEILLGFRTNTFGFDNVVSMEFKKAFDGTLTIYMCDGVHRNRVVNTFFTETGEYKKERMIFQRTSTALEESVNTNTSQFLSILKPPQGRLQEVSTGGELPCGNLFLYIRYLDYEYNKTNFLPLEGPISIFHGSDPFTIHGSNPAIDLDLSDKQIKVRVKYLDLSFKFFEIAIVRHTSEDPFALANKCMLLNRLISMDDCEYSTNEDYYLDIVLTGKEQFATISYDEIIRPPIKETICQAQIGLDKRWWGINWRESTYNKDAMAALARRVYGIPGTLKMNDMFNEDGSVMQDYINYYKGAVSNKRAWYQDSFQVLDNVGLFRGEIYPFGLVGLKDDGSFTEVFPITGYDCYEWGSGGYTGSFIESEWGNDEEAIEYLDDPDNTNCGFVRMPQFGTGDLEDGSYIDDMDRQIFFNVRIKYAFDYLNEHSEDFENIKGFYIVRADRFKNLVAHCITIPTSNHQTFKYLGHYLDSVFGVSSSSNIDEMQIESSLNIPLTPNNYNLPNGTYSNTGNIRSVIRTVFNNLDTDNDIALDYYYETKFAYSSNNKKALFSPNVEFAKNSLIENNKDYYIYIPNTMNMTGYHHLIWHTSGDDSVGYYFNNGDAVDGFYHAYSYFGHTLPNGRMSANGKILATNTGDDDIIYKYNNYSAQFVMNKYLHYYGNCAKKNAYNPYIKVSGVFVKNNTFSTIGKYSSKLQDIVLGENMNPGFKSWYTDSNQTIDFGNRDVRTPNYIGIDMNPNEPWPNDYIFWKCGTFPVMLYKEPNSYYGVTENYYQKMVRIYSGDDNNLSTIVYYLNNQFIDKEVLRKRLIKGSPNDTYVSILTDGLYIHGDCFLTRFFFRMNYNGESYSVMETDHSDPWKPSYDYGTLVSYPAFSEINTCLRGIGTIGFYPNWAKDITISANSSKEIQNYARFAGGVNGIHGEDFIYDFGYSVTQPIYPLFGIDNSLHNRATHYPTRVRYTNPHIAGAYVDGWRVMSYNSKKDFPIELGDAMAIAGYMDDVVMIHENATIQLALNNKVSVPESPSGTEVILGMGSIIADEYRKLADYGTQHSQIVIGMNGIYGYDYRRSIIWTIEKKTGTTSMYLSSKSISDTTIFSDIIKHKNLIDQLSGNTNYFDLYGSNVLGYVRGGVSLGFDDHNKEVLVSLLGRYHVDVDIDEDFRVTIPNVNINEIVWPGYVTLYRNGVYENIAIVDVGNGYVEIDHSTRIGTTNVLLIDLGFTYVFSELLQCFLERTVISPFYALIDRSIITYNRLFCEGSGKVYIHNDSVNNCRFYGFNDGFKIGGAINGSAEKVNTYHKMYGNVEIVSDDEPFDKLEIRTEFQYGDLYPYIDNDRFWALPIYNENVWKVNLPVQSSNKNRGYEPDSQMRGTWMEYKLIYRGTTKKYVGYISTEYVLSFN
jgi:hypothetical protein